MIDSWIDKQGKIHRAKDGENHYDIALRLFPESKDPERSCEKARYVKTGADWNGSPMCWCPEDADDMPQAQRNALERVWKEHYNS